MVETQYSFENLAEKFKAIGHPIRLSIFHLLCTCGAKRLKVKTIYETLKLEQASTSRHLDIMKRAGILERQREGNGIYYCLCDEDFGIACLRRCFNE
ncbi:winged helix-turn-helix transcriptional regulator [bacterium]|nr:winged helix-turn-helix transcriptional regulator [bacterium]